ncbi:PIH1 domain-containing protein 1-like [Periplaneta americana]|uniref:PIH1 domain-containing protein 1-like n=1 Tax=Periplaneta americana TaxID=6978 RepID=UPI0037E8D78F
MSSNKSSVLLEVDRSIIENNLLIQNNDELEELFPTQQRGDVRWKMVIPTPGMCVKTRTKDGNKVFINVCHTKDLPAPKDVGDDELLEIWTSEEADSSFRVPMSLGEGHEEVDKGGNPVIAYDVAINSDYFNKLENNKLFLSFFMTVAMEGLQEKYNIELEMKDYVILKNRRVLGKLHPHRVRQSGTKQPADPLIQEVSPPIATSHQPLIQEMTSATTFSQQPQYRIRREPPEADFPEYLLAEFFMKDLTSSRDLTLDVGEDRIILDSPGQVGQQAYKLDVFIPYLIDQDKCLADFNTDTKILTLTLPVVPAN